MFCQFCKVEIPPAWSKVIASNICPACGEAIISEESKKIMDELKDAITKMPNDPEGLAGWLMSTYDLLPKGSIEPTNFHRKPAYNNAVTNITPDGTPIKFANTPTNQFAKRAGVDKILNDPKLAAMQQMIHNINSVDGQMYGGVPEPESEEISEEEKELLEQQHMASLAAKAKAQGRKLTMRDALINSTEFNLGGDARPLSDAETEMVKHLVGGPSGDSEMEELQNLPPALQADRLKRLAAQRELKFGGSAGLIKRSG